MGPQNGGRCRQVVFNSCLTLISVTYQLIDDFVAVNIFERENVFVFVIRPNFFVEFNVIKPDLKENKFSFNFAF
jgi:hypothetical protein